MQLRDFSENGLDAVYKLVSDNIFLTEVWRNYSVLAQSLGKLSKCRENQIDEVLSQLRIFERTLGLPEYGLISLHRQVLSEDDIQMINGIAIF